MLLPQVASSRPSNNPTVRLRLFFITRLQAPLLFVFPDRSLFFTLLFVVAILPCCAQLPDYAAPQIRPASKQPTTFFTYRQLQQNDFRAPSLQEGTKRMEEHFNARSSVQIRPKKSTKILVRKSSFNGVPLYFADIDNLSFEAVFIPENSWWNPKIPAGKKGYVLQHEQIHFALLEITAQRISKEKNHYRQGLPIMGNTAREAQQLAIVWIQNIINSYNKDILDKHTEFDQDTSLYYSPKMQQRWWNHVSKELNSGTTHLR